MSVFKNIFVLRVLLFFLFVHLQIFTFSQDSSRLRISLLTCTPGEELYSTFGHSALRVIDSNSVTDHVYNYGTFNFEDEGFYLKFIRGQLRYYVSLENFEDFKAEYIFQNRGMTEQVLNFSAEEKIITRRALTENLREENKFYLYDFFLDNCTTRLRDIIVKNHAPQPLLPPVMPVSYTFRNAIHQYLDANNQPWSRFGIDVLMGVPTDAVMTTAEQQFLPDNLMYALDSVKNERIVLTSQSLYLTEPKRSNATFFTPMVFFTGLLLLFVLLSLSKNQTITRILKGLDGFLFFSVGLLGIVIVLMWTATDHIMTKDNYNLLWAWPTHIVYAFFLNRGSKRVITYSMLYAVFLLLLLGCWFFLAQEMNNALIPLLILLAWRTGIRGRRMIWRRGREDKDCPSDKGFLNTDTRIGADQH
ncbi:MAG: DUF4105 domain-containing protein [Ferruginibacter sp.]